MLNFLKKYNINDEVLAVGVSGGADSLALVLCLNECLKPVKKKVVALTVDHGLRPESGDEARYVHQLMDKLKIEHHTLRWEGKKPKTGIEEAARKARYRLLTSWCVEHQVNCLCVAHHALDQAETFMIRLQRGSGLSGLCGMREVAIMDGIKILRPFLNKNPEDLKQYLREHNINWITDSSNACDDFLRVRIRKFLPQMEQAIGITPKRIVETMKVLARSRDYIQAELDKFIKKQVRFWEDNSGASLSVGVLAQQNEEIIYRVLAELIKTIGKKDYTPRADDVERLQGKLFSSNFRGATLAGCEIFAQKGKLWIVPELKLKNRLPKKLWEEFVSENPKYLRMQLPYKLRVALVKTKMKVEF